MILDPDLPIQNPVWKQEESTQAYEAGFTKINNNIYIAYDGKFQLSKSLLNLSADLSVIKERSSLVFRGTATDLNFSGYMLEYADAKAPEHWMPIKPASDSPVVNDIFASWVPPYLGTFHVRLTVWDKAGNVAWNRKRVTWGESSKVTSLFKTEDLISPNGDGVKDTVELHYRVTDSVQLTFSIHDADQRLVRTFSKVHTAPGNDFVTWDGRDDDGGVVTDGAYRISVAGYDFFVEVDTTPPSATINLASFDLKDFSTSLSGLAYDSNMRNWRVEYGEGENPTGWLTLAEGRQNLAEESRDGQPVPDPLREVLIKELNTAEVGRFAGHRFRIVAEDRAGNVSSALSGVLEELIYLFRWDGADVSDHVPATLVRAGSHRLSGVETYRLLLVGWSLQYRLGKDWLNAPVEVRTAGGLIHIDWDNTAVAGEFSAVRLQAVDASGQLHYSNTLTTAQIFSLVSQCDQPVWGSNNLFENLQDLRYQYQVNGGDWLDYAVYDARIGQTIPEGRFLMIPPPDSGQVRLAATGLSGREYFSNAASYPAPPCSHAPKVKVEIQYPAGGACGGFGEKATITAQVEGKEFSPLSLSIFLQKDSGDSLLRRYEKSLSGSTSLNTAEIAEGNIPVRVEFAYLDLADGMTRQTTGGAILVADRTSPTAQITYPASDTLTLCPVRVSDPVDAWHGLPVEAMVLDNHAVRRYELQYGAGENPAVWLRAMTRQEGERKQIAGEGPIKGKIGIWDITGLQGTVYTLKLIVVDLVGNTSCHTATVAVDTLVAINDLSLDRKLYSPSGDDLPGGFSIGEPALVDIEVLELFRNSDNTFRVGHSPVRSLESAKFHPGGTQSFSWDGRNQAGVVAADGDYAVAVRATDGCGNGSLRWTPIIVDGTPPTILISYPTPGAPLPTVIEVKGTVSDPQFAGYTLEAGQDGDPDSWRTVVAKSTAVDDGVLGAWNTFGLEGVWNLRLSARDRAGNENQTLVAVDLERRTSIIRGLEVEPRIFSPNGDGRLDFATITYDLTAPSQVRIEILDKGGQQIRTETFAADGLSSFPWDGKNPLGAVGPDGEYRVRLTASLTETPDFHQTEEVSVLVDTTSPAINLAEPVAEAFLNVADLAFTGTVQDEHLLEYAAELRGPGGSRPLDSGSQNRIDHAFGVLTGLEEGPYVLSLEAADLAGNSTSVSRSFTIDLTAPKVRLDSPINGSVFGGPETQVQLAGEVIEENPAVFSLRYGKGENPTEWVELAGDEGLPETVELHSWMVDAESGLLDGNYTLSLRAADRAGLEGEARVNITIDNTSPEVSIDYPAEGSYLAGPVEIKGTAFDVNFRQAVVSLVEGSCAQTYRWAPLRNLTGPVKDGVLHGWQTLPPDGEYCLRLEAEDKVGNEASVVRGFRIDAQAPEPPVLQGEFAEKNGLRLEWTANGEDDLAGYNLYRNGLKINTAILAETTYLDASLAEGDYLYTVKAVDFAGNASETSNEVKCRVDLAPPSVKITAPEKGARLGNFVDIKGVAFSADDFKEYRIYIGVGDAPTAWELVRRSPLPVNFGQLARWDLLSIAEGAYSIRLEGEDLSGNIASQQITVLIDNTPPQAPNLISAVAAGADVAVAWQPVGDADLAGYLLFRNHQLVNAGGLVIGDLAPYLLTGTSYTDAKAPDGIFEYYLLAMDRAGNLSDQSNSLSVTIDTRVPKATIVEPLAGEKFDGGFTIRAQCPDEDIASIRLQYRRSTSPTWLNLAAPIPSPPYAILFDPQALSLAYGTYHFRAAATDWGGKTDPSPAFVAVSYTDLTPPEGPQNLSAVNHGGDIQLFWSANAEADLAGYNIYRVTGTLRNKVNGTPVTVTQYLRPDLPDGEHVYEITAVDLYGNESVASEPASARIYAPRLTPLAYGLTSLAQFTLSGSGAEPEAVIEIHNQTLPEIGMVGSGQATPTGEFTIVGIPLLAGENTLVARAINAKGGASKYSDPLVVFRGENPQAPTGLSGDPEVYSVRLDWNPSPEAAEVIGYNLYREGKRINSETAKVTSGIPSASSTYSSFAPSRAVDGNTATYWQSLSNTAQVPVWFELTLPQPEVIRRLEIDWGWTWSYAGRDFQVQGWTGTSWAALASITGSTQRVSLIDLPQTMATNRLRIHITGFNSSSGIIVIAELGVFGDSLIKEPAFLDAQGLTDGEYRYLVTAVNHLGFESPPSQECLVGVGDLIPPAPPGNLVATPAGSNVELDWSLTPNAEPDLAGFNVYRQTADGWQQINSTLMPGTSFVDPSLPNGLYSYRITAVDTAGNESDPSPPAQAAIAVEPPGSPIILGVVPHPEGKILSISWQAVSGAVLYNLYRGEDRGGPYSRVNEKIVKALSFVDTRLVNGREYFYVLTALDLAGNESAYSTEVRGVPEDILAPEMPIWTSPVHSGEQIVLDRETVSISGYAEPGAMVDVFRNGIAIGRTSSTETELILTHNLLLTGSGVIPSPDGRRIAFRDSANALWVKDLATGKEQKLVPQASSAAWAPDGSRLAYHYSSGVRTRVAKVELASGIVTFASADDSANERSPSWSEDGSKLVFASDRGGSWGVWVKDLSAGALTKVLQGSDIYSPRFSPDGRKIAYISGSRLYYYDIEGQTTTQVDDHPSYFRWSPDSGKLVFRSFKNNHYTIFIFELDGGGKTQITNSIELESFPAFSPDGNTLAFARRESASLNAVYISSLSGESRKILSDVSGLQYLDWHRSGQLMLVDGSGVHEIYPPGTFLLQEVNLYRGENHFYAIATDQDGNQGPSSEVMTVVFDNRRLPDLSVTAEEIYLYPLSPRLEEETVVNAVVRNVSATPVVNVAVDLYLWDASGDLKLIGSESLPALPAQGEAMVSATIRAGSAGGKHSVIVVVDPESLIEEVRKSNNTALKEFLVGGEERLELTASLDALFYLSRQAVEVEVSLMNSGPAQMLTLEMAIEDELGRTAADLSVQQVDLPFGAIRHFRPRWNTGATFAGNYRLRATARNSSGVLAEQLIPFVILPDVMVSAQISAGGTVFGAGEKVTVGISLKNTGFNNILAPVAVETIISNDQGAVVHQGERNLPSLWPGVQNSLSETWNTGLVPPGEYRVVSRIFIGPDLVKTASATFQVKSDVRLAGDISVASPIVLHGSEFMAVFSVQNDGNVNTGGTVVCTLIDPQSLSVLQTREQEVSLIQSVPQSGELVFTTKGLGLRQYQLWMRFVGHETEKALAQAFVSIKDGTPPQITVLSPEAGRVYESVIPLMVIVTDDVSGVDRVEYQMDGREWLALPVADQATGRFATIWEPSPQDGGEHAVRFRALDRAANRAEALPLAFEIQMDRQPPVTAPSISEPKYLSDAGKVFVSAATTFTLSATDDFSGVAKTEYRFGEGSWQLYSSPFSLADLADGENEIWYRSADEAGNVEDAQPLRIVLDKTAPETSHGFQEQVYMTGDRLLVSHQTEVILTAADHLSGVLSTQYRFDEEDAWRTYYGAFRFTDLEPGVHTIRFRSIDNVRNEEGETIIKMALIGLDADTEVLNLPRVLIWTRDPSEITGKGRPPHTLEDILSLAAEALGSPEIHFNLLTDAEAFRNEFRSDIYNIVMILDQGIPFDAIFLRELREAVHRGTGLLVSDWESSVHPILQDILGASSNGSLAMDEDVHPLHLFQSPVAAEQFISVKGRVLKIRLAGGTLAGIIPGESTCNGIRSLSLTTTAELQAGDQVTVSLSMPEDRELILIDEEQVVLESLPAGPVNLSAAHAGGDLVLSRISDKELSLSISAPYGYLGEAYSLAVTVEHPGGSKTMIEPVSITPVCGANLQKGMKIGPFLLSEIEEDPVRSSEDVPAVVLSEYGQGKTAFLSYDILGSALSGNRADHLGLLRNAAAYLLPETAVVEAGGVALLETRVRLEGIALDLKAVENLAHGFTHLPLFSLTTEPLEFTFRLEDGEESSYRYFVRAADRTGTFSKETAVLLGSSEGFTLFDRFPSSWTVESDSALSMQGAVRELEEFIQRHPEAVTELTAIKESLQSISCMPRTAPAEAEKVVHQVVQLLHRLDKLPFDTTELREILGEYLRIVERETQFMQ